MRRTPLRELLLGSAIAAAIFACSPGPTNQKATAPEYASPPPRAQLDPLLADISMMDEEIREFRRGMDLRSKPSDQQILEARTYSLAPLCPDNEPQSQTCESMCTLAQDICDNAKEICRIAGNLHGNSWAAGKCDSARASCKEAGEKCCGCNAKNGDDEADASGTW